jgi:hypothetical protein
MASLIEIAETQWFRFLSRWGLVGGLVYLSGFVLYATLAPVLQSSKLPPQYQDLALGTAQPTLYRLGMTNDMLNWLTLAGLFLGLAGVFARRAPIRSALLAACAGGQFIGFVGAALRFKGNTDLAAQYVTAAPDQQAVLLRSFLDLQYVVNACFFAGSWLWTVALVLFAWMAWSRAEFPRWLVGVVALNAAISVPAKVYEILMGESAPFVVSLVRIVLLMVICFCVAAAFWRRGPVPAPQVQPAPAH